MTKTKIHTKRKTSSIIQNTYYSNHQDTKYFQLKMDSYSGVHLISTTGGKTLKIAGHIEL